MGILPRAAAILRTLHWRRGLRAGFAVMTAMVVCRILGRSMGWAALGGFEAVLVDNGGPYRSRSYTIGAVLFGGALCGVIGSLVPQQLLLAALITAIVCFAVTYARVASQPIASTSVIILVIYFAGYGSADRSLHGALSNVLAYILGGFGGAALSLFFWPVDPFRPARLEVAGCYDLLAKFTASLHATSNGHAAHDDDHAPAVDFKRQLRSRLESAREALGTTPARAPVRTHRARNLSVLLETADMLFAATVRMTELSEIMGDGRGPATLEDIAQWLSGAERAIAQALRMKPADNGASFGPEGSHRIEYITRRTPVLAAHTLPVRTDEGPARDKVMPHLVADERDALQNVEIAFEAICAIWTGADTSLPRATPLLSSVDGDVTALHDAAAIPPWFDAVRQNWTLDSTMMRHSLRMAVVGAADVLLMRAVHVNHGFWLAMTSIIVLQPYSSGTLRKSFQRVGGTIAGGIVAAMLAAVIHSYTGIIIVITIGSILALATFAIDYGWYSFFLTPTFILLSLPYLRDWRYAGLRIFTTMLGAAVAVVAMRLLWPQSLSLEVGSLLSRCAAAVAAYLRAVLLFWKATPSNRSVNERELLAPARRACGLASQDAEEALDRVLLDPLPGPLHLGPKTTPTAESALTFTTYTRRFTQCLTTLAAVGTPTPDTLARISRLIARMDNITATLITAETHSVERPDGGSMNSEAAHFDPASSLAEQMLQRMERQAGVLERAIVTIAPHP